MDDKETPSTSAPEQEIVLNPRTQKLEAVSTTPATPDEKALVESWSRSDTRTNVYDDQFEYRGATVFFKSFSKKKQKALKAKEKELKAAVAKLNTQLQATEDEDEFERLTELIADTQISFFQDVVEQGVRGWKNGPLPYSPEAVADLSLNILLDWSLIMLEKSVLGKTQGEFLKNS